MLTERRNDLGNKVLVGVISMLVTLIMLFTIYTAKEALSLGNNNTKDVAVLQEGYKVIKENLVSINGKLDKLLYIK